MSKDNPIRATTYQVIAHGICKFCKELKKLRFAYNPYGDDQLMCENCADQSDYLLKEQSKNGTV